MLNGHASAPIRRNPNQVPIVSAYSSVSPITSPFAPSKRGQQRDAFRRVLAIVGFPRSSMFELLAHSICAILQYPQEVNPIIHLGKLAGIIETAVVCKILSESKSN